MKHSLRVTFVLLLLACNVAMGAEKKEITISLTVPDATWTIAIEQIHEVNDELWVVSTVSRDPDMMGAQVISTVRDSVKLAARDIPIKHFVIGKKWNWKNEEPYTFIDNLKQIEQELKSGKLVYPKTKEQP